MYEVSATAQAYLISMQESQGALNALRPEHLQRAPSSFCEFDVETTGIDLLHDAFLNGWLEHCMEWTTFRALHIFPVAPSMCSLH